MSDTEYEIKATDRGFPYAEFVDRNKVKCSIQKSSLAFEDCIWLGVDDAHPKVMASRAAEVGLDTEEKTGWVPYPIPDHVLLTTRMHLTRENVERLLPLLQRFVETGEIQELNEPES
jgi:hypothetical protein